MRKISEALNGYQFNDEEEFRDKQSLQGFILELFRMNNNQPLELDYITRKVKSVQQYLKRKGKSYKFKASLSKSIIGALNAANSNCKFSFNYLVKRFQITQSEDLTPSKSSEKHSKTIISL